MVAPCCLGCGYSVNRSAPLLGDEPRPQSAFDYALALPGTAWDIVTAQWWFQQSYQPVEQFAEATLYGRISPTTTPSTTGISMAYPDHSILDEL